MAAYPSIRLQQILETIDMAVVSAASAALLVVALVKLHNLKLNPSLFCPLALWLAAQILTGEETALALAPLELLTT